MFCRKHPGAGEKARGESQSREPTLKLPLPFYVAVKSPYPFMADLITSIPYRRDLERLAVVTNSHDGKGKP
jgi:hypothetical protein